MWMQGYHSFNIVIKEWLVGIVAKEEYDMLFQLGHVAGRNACTLIIRLLSV